MTIPGHKGTNLCSASLPGASNVIPIQLSQFKRQVEGLCFAIVSCGVAVDEASASFELHVASVTGEVLIKGARANDRSLRLKIMPFSFIIIRFSSHGSQGW